MREMRERSRKSCYYDEGRAPHRASFSDNGFVTIEKVVDFGEFRSVTNTC